MNSNNFPPGFENESKNLGIDFDGVIHNMDKGYHDGTCYGDPLPGALKALKDLSKKYTIIIYTIIIVIIQVRHANRNNRLLGT